MNSTTYISAINRGCNAGALIANKAEPLEKVTKLTGKMIEFSHVIFNVLFNASSKAVTLLTSRLKDTSEVCEVVQVVGRYRELCCPDKNGRYFIQTNSWQKVADRVFLTAHVTFKVVGFTVATGLITLGKIGAYAIGQLAVFKLVTELLVCISSGFGLWDTKNKLTECYKDLSLSARKIEKWSHRSEYLEKIRNGDKETIDKLQENYDEKLVRAWQDNQELDSKLKKIKQYMSVLEKSETEAHAFSEKLSAKLQQKSASELLVTYAEKSRAISEKVAVIQLKQKKYDDRLTAISSKEHQELAKKLSQKNIEFEVLKWEIKHENTSQAITKSWLAVAKSIFKLAVISLVLPMIALNMWTTTTTLVILGLGILHDGTGVIKIFYDEYVKPKPMPLHIAAPAA